MLKNSEKNIYKVGFTIFVILLVLTIVEYGISVTGVSWAIIFFGIAAVKAWFVIQNYMHLPRLFKKGSLNDDN